jgi:hypothetical protein
MVHFASSIAVGRWLSKKGITLLVNYMGINKKHNIIVYGVI